MYESKELKQEKETLPTTTLKNSSTNPMQLASILGNRGMIQLMGLEKQESKPNNTGIPTQMKQSFEERSGLSFDDVQVHYNSDKPAQLQALAYTQGNQVYVGPGQEKHLGHELGHVVQQKQGRVSATTNVNGMEINDDIALEREADDLLGSIARLDLSFNAPIQRKVIQCARLSNTKLNVVGETHADSDKLGVREKEKILCAEKTGSNNYWNEYEFRVGPQPFFRDKRKRGDPFKPRVKYCIAALKECLDPITQHHNHPLFQYLALTKDFFKLLNTLVGNLYSDYEGFTCFFSDRGSELTPTENTNYQTLKNDIFLLKPLLITLYQKKDSASFINFRNKVEDLYNNLNTIEGGTLIPKRDPYIKQRSEEMHYAAEEGNSTHYTLGVWKIGDRHRQDIEALPVQRNYNLISQDDFYIEYDIRYPSEKHPK